MRRELRIVLTRVGAATDREEPRELHQGAAGGAIGELLGQAHGATNLGPDGAARMPDRSFSPNDL
jgi:hypothetical protein